MIFEKQKIFFILLNLCANYQLEWLIKYKEIQQLKKKCMLNQSLFYHTGQAIFTIFSSVQDDVN